MDDALRMCRVESVGNLDRQTEQYICLHRLSGDAVLQRQAVQKLHNEKRMAVLLSNLMDCADIGMVESGSRLRLPLEAGQDVGVFGDVFRQKLQRDKPVQG